MLKQQLVDHGIQTALIDELMKLLAQWHTNPGVGLLQGHNPSSLLGNIYLDPVDKVMYERGTSICVTLMIYMSSPTLGWT